MVLKVNLLNRPCSLDICCVWCLLTFNPPESNSVILILLIILSSFCHPVILSSQPGSSNLSLDCSRLTEGQIQLVRWAIRSWIQLIEFPANWSSPSPHGVGSVKLISRSPPLHIEMLGLVHSLRLTSMCLNICQKQISSNNFIKVVLDHRGLYSVNTQNSKRIWNLISKGAKGQENWPLGVCTFGSWVQHSLMQCFKLVFSAPQSSNCAKLKQGPIIINIPIGRFPLTFLAGLTIISSSNV